MQPEVSVVVPAYRAGSTLPACVAALLAQVVDCPFEVIVLASADDTSELPRLSADPRLRVLTAVPRMTAAEARNLGAAEAKGRALAFTDANAVPSPGWLRALLAAAGSSRVAAGAVRNANPSSRAATVEYLVEFVDLHPARPAGTAWHGAGCNLLFPRRMWDRYGPWPDLGGGEDTLLTGRARADRCFVFVPDAVVDRVGRTRLGEVLVHQHRVGRWVARAGRLGPHKLRPLVRYTPLAPVATAGRIVSVYGRVVAWDRGELARAVVLSPLVLAALVSWGTGLFAEGRRLDRGAPVTAADGPRPARRGRRAG